MMSDLQVSTWPSQKTPLLRQLWGPGSHQPGHPKPSMSPKEASPIASMSLGATTVDSGSGAVSAKPVHAPRRLPLFLATVVVSFYVGYFGAGAGFLFMTLLALFGYEDIHVINALKVVANLLANGIAFAIFIVEGQVVWRFCLAAMVAAAIGGYASASLARRVPQPVLRGIVVAIGLTMAAWFFWRQ